MTRAGKEVCAMIAGLIFALTVIGFAHHHMNAHLDAQLETQDH